MSDRYTIYNLDEDIETEFKETLLPRLKEGEHIDNVRDSVHESADSLTPIYYSTQIELADSHNSFLHEKPNLGDGDNTPMEALALNIYDYIYQQLDAKIWEWDRDRCPECDGLGIVYEENEDGEEVEVKCTECDYWEEEDE